jgi:hypothetical protein
MSEKVQVLKRAIENPDYVDLVRMGLLSHLAERNFRLVESYTALRKSGVAPLRASRQTAKTFRCTVRRVYQILSEVDVIEK